jgi:hypothetical protein
VDVVVDEVDDVEVVVPDVPRVDDVVVLPDGRVVDVVVDAEPGPVVDVVEVVEEVEVVVDAGSVVVVATGAGAVPGVVPEGVVDTTESVTVR